MQGKIDFDSILNARDFGVYKTDLGPLRTGYLYRTAHLSEASEADMYRLDGLDIGLLVDLRYHSERQRQPNKWPRISDDNSQKTDPATQVFVFDGQRQGMAPHEVFMAKHLHKAEDGRAYMIENYAERPHQDGFRRITARTLQYMRETGEPILIHCAAGKDRTGLLAALILKLLGVHDDDIMTDYLNTMNNVDWGNLVPLVAKRMSEEYGRLITPEILRPMYGVEAEYLQASLDKLGPIDDYVKSVLELDPKALKADLAAAYISNAN